jgi:DUF1009 family protein
MKKLLGTVVTILVLSGVNVVKAQEPQNEINLTTIDCRTLLQMDGDDKDSTILFFHGYMTAKNNETAILVDKLGEATDNVVNYCIDNPDDTLLNTFIKYRPAP